MKIPYKHNMPIVKISVKGPKGEREYDAYLDTGAGRTLIPERDAIKLGLPYVGDASVITGSGKDAIKVFMATVTFLEREFYIPIFARDLPEQAIVKAIVGRDILDNCKVCFDGRNKELVFA